MAHKNIEIKAKCSACDRVRSILLENKAKSIGTAHQVDTYFNVGTGKLKLRESDIEDNELIYYERQDKSGPKQSNITIVKNPDMKVKGMLASALSILAVVDKMREIYWIGNVKFHLDKVRNLGEFMEIEAVDYEGTIEDEKLHAQCRHYMDLLGIKENDLVSESYSDMIIAKQQKP